jgi:hypothetical protein
MRKLLALQGVVGVALIAAGAGLTFGLGVGLIAAGAFLLVGAWMTR